MATKKIKSATLQDSAPQETVVMRSPKTRSSKTEKSTARAAKAVAAEPTTSEKGFKPAAGKRKPAEVAEDAAVAIEKPDQAGKAEKVKAEKVKAEKVKAEKIEKSEKSDKSEKPAKMKRLTLDVSKPLHKAIKAKAVDEGMPMADMLRSLLEQHYA
jgi:predicted DNA binding CopG/RHH family protein